MKELLNKPLPDIPAEIQEKLKHPNITLTTYENKNDVLNDSTLQQDVGFKQFRDGKLAGEHGLPHARYYSGNDRMVVLVACPG